MIAEKVSIRTIRVIAGKKVIQGATSIKLVIPSDIIFPRDGIGFAIPNPKKLKAASVPMALAKLLGSWASIGIKLFGKMCTLTIWISSAPIICAAST